MHLDEWVLQANHRFGDLSPEYNIPTIQDASSGLEMDVKLSPVGAIQGWDVHLFDIHFSLFA